MDAGPYNQSGGFCNLIGRPAYKKLKIGFDLFRIPVKHARE
jgi:hypothetical protein